MIDKAKLDAFVNTDATVCPCCGADGDFVPHSPKEPGYCCSVTCRPCGATIQWDVWAEKRAVKVTEGRT